MKTKYVVVLTVETSERVAKKEIKAWVGGMIGIISAPPWMPPWIIKYPEEGGLVSITKLRVRSVDVD